MSRIHQFDFINFSDHSRLINSNLLQRKSLIFCCALKDFDLITRDYNIGGRDHTLLEWGNEGIRLPKRFSIMDILMFGISSICK